MAFAVPNGTGNEIFNERGNVGIGTLTSQGKVVVIGGNVGLALTKAL